MDPLLFSLDDCLRFLTHTDKPVRRWATEYATRHFPVEACDALLGTFEDDDSYRRLLVAQHLAKHGDLERHGPRLLAMAREKTTGEVFGAAVETLARLGASEVGPLILERIEQACGNGPGLPEREAYALIAALRCLGGDVGRQGLWRLVPGITPRSFYAPTIVEALLHVEIPEGVRRLVGVWCGGMGDDDEGGPLRALVLPFAEGRFYDEVLRLLPEGVAATHKAAEWELGCNPVLSQDCLDEFARSAEAGYAGIHQVALKEARRKAEVVQADVPSWTARLAAGESLIGYRRQAPVLLAVLEALCERSPETEFTGLDEAALALSLLYWMAAQDDDEATLEQSDDLAGDLLFILGDGRAQVLPDIIKRIVAVGPQIAPRVIAQFDPTGEGWEPIRIARTIEALARRYPGCCDAAVPRLLEAVFRDQGDYLLEAASEALVAIGSVAAQPVLAHMRADDPTADIFLSSVLGQIGTEDATRALLEWCTEVLGSDDDWVGLDEWHVSALQDTGSADAVPILLRAGYLDAVDVAEALLVLCEVNGVAVPELADCRQFLAEVAEERQRRDARWSEELRAMGGALRDRRMPDDFDGAPPGTHSGRDAGKRKKPKLSKGEQKKRASQRKKSKRKR